MIGYYSDPKHWSNFLLKWYTQLDFYEIRIGDNFLFWLDDINMRKTNWNWNWNWLSSQYTAPHIPFSGKLTFEKWTNLNE